MKLFSLLAVACSTACFSGAASAAVGRPEISRTKTEVVKATFANAAEAQRAEMTIAPLYGGAPMCFTTRWDDSSWLHPAKAEMFKRIGLTPCFFLNHSDQFARRELPKIKALGGRFGNHSYSHPFLMESGVNRIFFEIVANKAWVESVSDMPCTTFAMPYNWGCQLEPKRAAKLAKILVDSGTFVSSNGPVPEGEQPPQEWLVGHNFNIGDDAPRADQFWTNVERGLRANEKDGGLYPKLTLGTHSSRNAGVNEKQEDILKDAMKKHPEWWWTDDAHYGAYRYEFWHSKIVKTGVKGNVATFEVTRHDPAFLGAVQDLTYTFGDLKPLKVEMRGGFDKATALPEKIDTVKEDGTSDEFPGVRLRVKVDETKGLLAYAFEGGDVLEVLVNPAPMWEHSRLMFTDAKKKVELGKRNPAADYNDGDRLYCVGVDFLRDGKRGRVYSLTTVEGARSERGGTPRDCAMVLGPFETPDLDDAFWTPKSVPGVELPNLGPEINRYWRSMSDPKRCGFSAAAYVGWDPGVKPEFKEALKRAKPGDHARFLVALDFVCTADGEKDFLCNVGDREEVVAYVNGEKLTFKGGKNRIKVKKGLNRMLYRWVWTSGWTPQSALIAICDDQSVDRQVRFVTPKTEKRDSVFESDGWSVEFKPDGQPRLLLYAGRKVIEGVAYENGRSLDKKPCEVKPVFRHTADSIVCTRDCPLGTASDDFAYRTTYTVTRDSITFKGLIQVKAGTSWKGANAMSTLYAPISFYSAKPLTITDAKGAVSTLDYPKSFDARTCRLPKFQSLSNGDWTLELDAAETVTFVDRRQWNNPTASLQLCPAGGCQWNGKVSDGTAFIWGWTLRRN